MRLRLLSLALLAVVILSCDRTPEAFDAADISRAVLDRFSDKIGPAVIDSLRTYGKARIVIALDIPRVDPRGPFNARALAELKERVGAAQREVAARVAPGEMQESSRMDAVPALVGTIRELGTLARLAASPRVLRIELDGRATVALGSSVEVIKADLRHDAGNKGNGVVVAIIDTGIDTDHPELSDDLVGEECFGDLTDADLSGICPNGTERQSGPGSAEDVNGHGTFVAGIVTSNGTEHSSGVAPGAGIVMFKLFGASETLQSTAQITRALGHIVSTGNALNVKVVSISIASELMFPGLCDLAYAEAASTVATLRTMGVVVLAASGNEKSYTHMPFPACLSQVISVGATYDSDEIWIEVKGTNTNSMTDLFAPGANISSTMLNGDWGFGGSGTSWAAPHAAGCAALLIEAGDATTPDAIEARLKTSSVQITDSRNGLTFPRLDCKVDGAGKPLAPSDLQAVVSVNAVDLSWANPAVNETRVQVFSAFLDGSTWTAWVRLQNLDPNATTFADVTSLPGTYRYRVRTCNAAGCSGYSNTVKVETKASGTPAVPTNLHTTSVTDASVSLAWNDNASNETKFRVYRSVAGGSSVTWDLIHTAAQNVTQYVDASVASGTTYKYRLRACNATGCSVNSNIVQATITGSTIPTLTSITTSPNPAAANQQFTLTVNGSNFNPATARVVIVGPGCGAPTGCVVLNSALSTKTSVKLVGPATLSLSGLYFVTAANGSGDLSNPIQLAVSGPPPQSPTNLAAEAGSSTRVDLAWSDNSLNESGFKVERAPGGTSNFVLIGATGQNVAAYADVSVVANTAYRYRVIAFNNTNVYSSPSNIAEVTTPLPPPDSVLSNGSFSSGTSNWTLSGDFWAGSGSGFTGYRTSPGYAAGGVDTGGSSKNSAFGTLRQTVSLPAGRSIATLTYWYNITSEETGSTPYDVLNVTILSTSGAYLASAGTFSNVHKTTVGNYSKITVDLSSFIGQTVQIQFAASTDASLRTVFRIDDVGLVVQ